MEAFVKKLHEWLQTEFDGIDPETSPVKGYNKKIELVEKAITHVKAYLVEHPFPNKDTEIQYFKDWIPSIFKQHIYFTALYNLELFKITSDKADFLAHVGNEKKRIADFFKDHGTLHKYYHSQRTTEDATLFVYKMPSMTSDFLVADAGFCKASLVLAELLAYEDYKAVLEAEIKPTGFENGTSHVSLQWVGSKTEAVEWTVLCYEGKLFNYNGKPATLEQIKNWVETQLNIDLHNFTVLDNAGRYRKKTTTPLLEKFIRASKDRQDRLNP